MKNEGRMPHSTAGIVYTVIVISLTMISMILLQHEMIATGHVENLVAVTILVFSGVFISVCGAVLWINSMFGALNGEYNPDDGSFSTKGPYSFVRNPRLSGIAMMCTGVLMCLHNLWLLVLPVFFYLLLTLLMLFTEERRYRKMFGDEYREYCRKVNRCIPWFPKEK